MARTPEDIKQDIAKAKAEVERLSKSLSNWEFARTAINEMISGQKERIKLATDLLFIYNQELEGTKRIGRDDIVPFRAFINCPCSFEPLHRHHWKHGIVTNINGDMATIYFAVGDTVSMIVPMVFISREDEP